MIEVDKKKVLDVLKEISNSMTRAEAERDFQKEAIKAASDEHQIDKKTLRKMARVYHRQNFSQEVQQHEEFEQLYETIVQ